MQINVPIELSRHQVEEILDMIIGDDEYEINDEFSTLMAEAVVGIVIAEWAQVTISCNLHRSGMGDDLDNTREKLIEAGMIVPVERDE